MPFSLPKLARWIVAAAAVVLLAMYLWWLHGQNRQLKVYRATLISVASSSTLTSSFARVDIFRVLDKQGQWHAVNSFGPGEDTQQIDLGKLKAFCSRTLDITFGYRDFRAQAQAAAADNKALPLAQMLTVNTVNASDWGEDSARQCLSRFEGDLNSSMIKDALVTDGVWEVHVRNGAQVFVEASRRLFGECEPGSSGEKTPASPCPYDALLAKRDKLLSLDIAQFKLASRCFGEENNTQHSAACTAAQAGADNGRSLSAELRANEHVASVLSSDEQLTPQSDQRPLAAFGLDNAGGYEGTVVLTMSAMAIIGSERRVRLLWVIPLWTKDAFYFRREIAQVTFGSHIGNRALRRTRMPWFGPKLVLTVGDPMVLSIDRRVAAQGRSGDLRELEKPGRSLSTEANDGILGALRTSVQSYDTAARAMSRTIIRDRYESDDVDVEFTSERNDGYARVFPAGD
jgi:hypothetical protein